MHPKNRALRARVETACEKNTGIACKITSRFAPFVPKKQQFVKNKAILRNLMYFTAKSSV